VGNYGLLTGRQQDQPARRSRGPDSCSTRWAHFRAVELDRVSTALNQPVTNGTLCGRTDQQMEEGRVPLAWLNPSIPISWPGRVLRTPAGPPTSRLPSSWPLCSSRWRYPGVGDAAECEDYLACQHADHLPPRSPRTRERRGGTPKAPWTAATVRERLPGQAEPGRVAIIRPCAPYDPRRRTRSFSCWEIAVAGCGRSRIVK
jgi:hypothetical protein